MSSEKRLLLTSLLQPYSVASNVCITSICEEKQNLYNFFWYALQLYQDNVFWNLKKEKSYLPCFLTQ